MASTDSPLVGKVALITGSTSGIGEAIARRFADAGATVALNSVHSVEAGERLAGELPGATYCRGSVADPDDCRRLVDDTVARHGGIDILVNNAGTTRSIPHRDLDAASLDVWREIFDTNVFGTWELTRLATPHLVERSGTVIMTTSLAGVRPTGSSVPYACSKAALNHLTALLANTLGPDVRVNAIAPGLVETPWTEDWDDLHAAVAAMAPMQRSATPEDLCDVALLLATNTYLTGQVVVVDGGLGLR